MGRASGTGSPITLVCPVARRNRDPWTYALPRGHALTRTGRSRLRAPSGALGSRSMLVAYEYDCTCGHHGWTNHVDVLRRGGPLPEVGEAIYYRGGLGRVVERGEGGVWMEYDRGDRPRAFVPIGGRARD